MKKLSFLLGLNFTLCALVAKTQNVGINNTNPQAALDLQGDLRLRSAILTLPAGLNNDVDLTTVKSSVYMFGGGALTINACQITGFTGGVDGRVVTIFNNSTIGSIQLYDANFSVSPSAATNKILTGTGNNAVIFSNGSATLRYDGAKAKWIIMSSNFVDGLNANASWYTNGNTGTTALNFIGTSDVQDVIFKQNNIRAGLLNSTKNNTSWGVSALNPLTTGDYNTATGYNALTNNTTGNSNTANGVLALNANTTGYSNTAIGSGSLSSNTIGLANTGLGSGSLSANTTGNANTALGGSALTDNTTGSSNVAIGASASSRNTTGYSNVAIGRNALVYNTFISNTVAIGDSALFNNGVGVLYNTDAIRNTAIGSKSLFSNTTGGLNTAIGFRTLYNNTTGFENTASGVAALYNNTTGFENTANGNEALSLNTTGNDNTAIGAKTLSSNTTGNFNTANGNQSLYNNTNGVANTANGSKSLRSNTAGNFNTANGSESLFFNTTGDDNTANGVIALYNNITGKANTANGCGALSNNSTGNFNTAIGNDAGVPSGFSNLDNTVTIGYNSRTNTLGLAILGNTTTTFCGGYKNWSNFSDGRFKTNVTENVIGLDFIKQLRPVTYQVDMHGLNNFIYKDKTEEYEKAMAKGIEEKMKVVETGFIAQEVEAAAKKVGYNFDGVNVPKDKTQSHYSISYASFVVPLVKAVQEQQIIIETQNSKIDNQQKQIEAFKNQQQNLQQQIDELKKLLTTTVKNE